jgi:hypothetical protein
MKEAKRKQSDESRLRKTDEEISMARDSSLGVKVKTSRWLLFMKIVFSTQGRPPRERWKTICDFLQLEWLKFSEAE